MKNKELERCAILDFLQWEDKDFAYTDSRCDKDGIERISLEEAKMYFYMVLFNKREFYNEIEDAITFNDIVDCLSVTTLEDGQNALELSNSLIERLVSTKNKEEIYIKK